MITTTIMGTTFMLLLLLRSTIQTGEGNIFLGYFSTSEILPIPGTMISTSLPSGTKTGTLGHRGRVVLYLLRTRLMVAMKSLQARRSLPTRAWLCLVK